MRFRLGLVTGFATGYYLGARAGRQRYDQMNRALAKLRRTDAYEDARERARSVVEDAAEKAKAVVEESVDKARAAVHSNGSHDTEETVVGEATAGIILPTDPPTGLGGYSSSR